MYSLWVRQDSDRNIHRYYYLHIQPTLFGEWDVIRQWGRVGQRGGQQRVDHYLSYDEAKHRYEALCLLREKHHYSPRRVD
jgi:predicted DNA-binding WGR domain protein